MPNGHQYLVGSVTVLQTLILHGDKVRIEPRFANEYHKKNVDGCRPQLVVL